MEELYRQNIMDHNASPRNFGEMKDADVSEDSHNPSCGDRFRLYLRFSDDKTHISSYSFSGVGCAISTASFSILGEELLKKPIEEVRSMTEDDLRALLGVEISPGRDKCAFTSLRTAHKALEHLEQ